jgi:hypothetical protein
MRRDARATSRSVNTAAVAGVLVNGGVGAFGPASKHKPPEERLNIWAVERTVQHHKNRRNYTNQS